MQNMKTDLLETKRYQLTEGQWANTTMRWLMMEVVVQGRVAGGNDVGSDDRGTLLPNGLLFGMTTMSARALDVKVTSHGILQMCLPGSP